MHLCHFQISSQRFDFYRRLLLGFYWGSAKIRTAGSTHPLQFSLWLSKVIPGWQRIKPSLASIPSRELGLHGVGLSDTSRHYQSEWSRTALGWQSIPTSLLHNQWTFHFTKLTLRYSATFTWDWVWDFYLGLSASQSKNIEGMIEPKLLPLRTTVHASKTHSPSTIIGTKKQHTLSLYRKGSAVWSHPNLQTMMLWGSIYCRREVFDPFPFTLNIGL